MDIHNLKLLFTRLSLTLTDAQKREESLSNPDKLQAIAEKGNEKTRKVAQETMQLVRKAMGLGPDM